MGCDNPESSSEIKKNEKDWTNQDNHCFRNAWFQLKNKANEVTINDDWLKKGKGEMVLKMMRV